MNYAGAIFDQDGLLFDTERIYQESWILAARDLGIDMPVSFPRQFCGLGGARIGEIVARAYPQIDYPSYHKAASERARSRQLAETPVKKPGLEAMLSFCRAHGIKTAVASSSRRNVVEHNLAAAGVRGYFDAIATGDEVTRSKPDPDIFLLAAQRIGIEPARCVVFEDAASGIRGARAAGCGAVLIPDLVPPTDEIRSLCSVYPDLNAAMAVFG